MGRGAVGLDSIPATQVRRDLKQIFDRAIHGHLPVPLERGTAERMFGIGSEELAEVLAVYEFHPQVMFDEDVSIWLPEFALYGTGKSYEEAKADLTEEVRDYVADYFDENDPTLRSAPNRRRHYPYALRVAVADFAGQLDAVLFAEPRELVGAGA